MDSKSTGKRKAREKLVEELKSCRRRVQELEQALVELKDARQVPGKSEERLRREKVEEELVRSEEEYRILVETINEVIYETDENGIVTFVSSSATGLKGYEPSDIVGRHITDFVYHEDIPRLLEMYQKILVGPIPPNEYRLILKSGGLLWVQASSRAIFEGERFKGLRGTLMDISERKRAERAQRESETKYRELVEFLPIAIFETDLQCNVTSANPAALDIFGYGQGDISRRLNGFHMVVCQNPGRIPAKFEEVLRGERTGGAECMGIRKDGSVFPAVIYASRIMRGETPVGVRGAVIDLTERKRAEEAVWESEERFRQLADSTYEGILIHVEGEILDFNQSFLRMVGYEPHEAIGKNVLDFIPPQFRQSTLNMMQSQYENSFEISVNRKDGTLISVEVHGRRITHRGRQVGVIALHDITERKRAEEEHQQLEKRLQQAEKMEALGALAGGVAHDLNNVLGVLVGYSELLLLYLQEGDPLREYALNILQSGRRGAAIIQDLLTLARRSVAVSDVVSLNSVVLDYLNTPEFEKLKMYHPHVTIKTDLEKDLLNIEGSPVHLGKTVMNLVSNAAESITDQGQVTIRTENRYLDRPIRGYDDVKEGDYVVLTVSDNGQGISPADIGKIFEPFYTKKVMGRSGTGLGLAVVWGTVKDHGGYIDVQSEEGKGSSFALYFPATRKPLARDKEEVSPELYRGCGESILVVDDVEGQRELAASMLMRLGYRVHSVSSGEEAVEYLKINKVDLLVLDMIMDPGIDGFETYRQATQIRPGQRAVIVSGFSETERVKMARDLGAGAYVQKPYSLEKIGMAVHEELRKKGS
ncbi:MAG: PAS domain S-box protein [Syntrophales bacterium]